MKRKTHEKHMMGRQYYYNMYILRLQRLWDERFIHTERNWKNIKGKHDKIDGHFSLWLDSKRPQKRFIPR